MILTRERLDRLARIGFGRVGKAEATDVDAVHDHARSDEDLMPLDDAGHTRTDNGLEALRLRQGGRQRDGKALASRLLHGDILPQRSATRRVKHDGTGQRMLAFRLERG